MDVFLTMEFRRLHEDCSSNGTVWIEKEKLNCDISSKTKYHCLIDQNESFGEVCVAPVWIQPNLCPSYNTISKKVDVYHCELRNGQCPISTYQSSNAYKFSACLTSKKETPTSTVKPLSNSHTNGDGGIGTLPMILLGAVIPVILIAVIVGAVIFCRLRRKNKHDDERAINLTEEEHLCIAKEIQDHLTDKTFFKETKAITQGSKILDKSHFLVYVGIPGSGKTKAGLEILANKMRPSSKHVCVVCHTLDDLKSSLSSKKTAFLLLDDYFEPLMSLKQDSDLVTQGFEDFTKFYGSEIMNRRDRYLIVTVGSHTWRRFSSKFEQCKAFSSQHVLDLSKVPLSSKDKSHILEKHACARNIEIMHLLEGGPTYPDKTILHKEKVDQIIKGDQIKEVLGFPEACDLYCGSNSFFPDPVAFFRSPREEMKKAIKKLEKDSNITYCTLVYALFKGGEIDLKKFDGDVVSKIMESCKRPSLKIGDIEEGVKFVLDKFLKKSDRNTYRFLYDIITLSVMEAVGETDIRLLIDNCDSRTLQRFVRTRPTIPDDYNTLEYVIPDSSIDGVAKRFANVSYSDVSVFEHVCLSEESFLKRFANARAQHTVNYVNAIHDAA